MNKLKGLLIIFSLISIQMTAQEKKISLNEAIDLSLQNSKQLKINQAKIEEATAAAKEAEERKLPDAKVSGSYLRLNSANFDLKTKSNNSGSGSSSSEAIDSGLFHARRIDVFDPAGDQISGERLLRRYPDDVEPQCFATAALYSEHGLGGVIERKALRRGEGETQFRVQESAAAHKAFAGILAIDNAVDVRKIGRLGLGEGLASLGRRAVLARRGDGIGDAFWRRWMR